MKRVWRTAIGAGLVLASAACAMGVERKVLVIGIDGMRPDARLAANAPNMDALIANGASSEQCMVEDITISGPCWSSMFCGVHRNKHGVTGNTFAGSNYTQYPHFFKRLEESCDIQTASFVNWSPLNVTILQNGADKLVTGVPDAQVASEAAAYIQSADPDVVIVAFDEVDGAGHANGFGPNVPAYVAKIEQTDVLLGQVLAAVRARPTYANEDWLVTITSDHGGTPDGSHGRDIPEHRLVNFVVSGASTARGTIISPAPEIVDLPATIFTFLGLPINPAWGWDGVARGLNMGSSTSQAFACSPPPPPPVGACCLRSGACSVLVQGTCVEQRGVWRGTGSACAAAACSVPIVVFSQNFDGLTLGPSVNEVPAGTNVWTNVAPSGWTIDNTGLPTGGMPEWSGWAFTSPTWWSQVAQDQNRSQFSKGSGAIAVADPDEWDDAAHAPGTFNSRLRTPAISLTGIQSGSAVLMFDSSWRPEGNQTASLTASYNGGTPVTVFTWGSSGATLKADATNETVVVGLNNPAGATNVVLTFAMTNAGNNWWWAIDNVELVGTPVQARRLLLSENFDQLPLGPNVNEAIGGEHVWTETPPAGWSVNDSGVPGVNDPAVGMKEWEGWAFTYRPWWVQIAGDQNRSQFTKGSGTIAVADPDEWDDRGTPAPSTLGPYNAVMSSKTIKLRAVRAGSLNVQFDSSWRAEGVQRARLQASYNGQAPVTVLQWDSAPGPTFKADATNETVSLALSNPSGATSVRLDFAMLDARNNWWWAIDNLSVTAASAACACDYSSDGVVGVQDVFEFLSDWFAGDGDFDRDGNTGVQDIFSFLACFFGSSGCS